jgi:hypothetical protein
MGSASYFLAVIGRCGKALAISTIFPLVAPPRGAKCNQV